MKKDKRFPENKLTRRKFLKLASGFFAGNLLGLEKLLKSTSTISETDKSSVKIPRRKLGKTGYKTGIFSLGGEAAVEQSSRPEQAQKIVNRALDLGVNYIDTAPSYGRGGSETNIGAVMKERREEVFLATKTHDRTYSGTLRLFERSLERLNTDYIDLYQIHSIRTESDLKRIFSSTGTLKAMEKLKEEGTIKNIGITGHYSPEILLKAIKSYDFDCLLMTLNGGDIHYRPFGKEILSTAVEKKLGIIAMKVAAKGRIFKQGGITSMKQALGYTLTFPVSTAIVGISSISELEENVEIAKNFKPFSDDEIEKIHQLTRDYQREANFFKYHW